MSFETLTFPVFHKGKEIPVKIKFFYTPAEKPTPFTPGVPEDFEIFGVTIPEEYVENDIIHQFSFSEFLAEEFDAEIDLIKFSKWIEGLEQTAIKVFYYKIDTTRRF